MTIEAAKTILGLSSLCDENEVGLKYKKALKLYHPDNKLSKKHTISEVKEAREILLSLIKRMKAIGNNVSSSTDVVDVEDVARLKNKVIDKIVSAYGKEMVLSDLVHTEPMIRIHGSIDSLSGLSEFEFYQRYNYMNEYTFLVNVEVDEVHMSESEMTLNFCDKRLKLNMISNDSVVKTVVGNNMTFTIQIHRRVKSNES